MTGALISALTPAFTEFDTHAIFNQAPPFCDVNLFATDPALREAVVREGAGSAVDELGGRGRLADRRPQVVLLGAAVRCAPEHPGAGAPASA